MRLMLISIVAIVSAAFITFAASSYDVQIESILGDMASTNRDVRLNATNRLDTLIAATTNREQLATCKLLKAKLRIECEDIMGDEQIYDSCAFHDATNLCWDVLRTFSNDEKAWQFYGATLLLPLPLSMNKQHREAYSIATNAIATLDVHGEVSVDTNVWTVLFSPESLHQGNIRMALRTLAAVALSHADSAADISSYTNGLPVEVLQVINDVRSDLCD